MGIDKAKVMRRLFVVLLIAVGAGLGLCLANLGLPLAQKLFPKVFRPVYMPVLVQTLLALLGALLLGLFSGRIRQQSVRVLAAMEQHYDKMEGRQVFCRVCGLLIGLVLAFLCTRLLLDAGRNVLTLSLSAILYLGFGYGGVRIGDRRFRRWKLRGEQPRTRRRHRRISEQVISEVLGEPDEADESEGADGAEESPAASAAPKAPEADRLNMAVPKLLDSSVIIDGRLLPLYRFGLLEGELRVPGFVLSELQQLADSADPARRLRGRRGLDLLQQLKDAGAPVVTDDAMLQEGESVDTALLRLCRRLDGLCLTNDTNLCKVAAVAGVRTLSLFELFDALRLTLSSGDVLQVAVTREGKELGQGVAYLDDGTMVVVEGGRCVIGQTVPVTVTSVLQTSAGRMVFARYEAGETA